MAASRSSRLFIAGLLILLLLWGLALGALLRFRGQDQFSAAATIDPRFSARPGANLVRADLAPDRLPAILAELADQGITYVRFTLPWDEIEPARGQFAWEPWDSVAEAFARYPALHPVVVLDRSPAWARGEADLDNPLAPPHERRDFGSFAAEAARRYAGRFTYYQIWNEPNIAPHWARSRPTHRTTWDCCARPRWLSVPSIQTPAFSRPRLRPPPKAPARTSATSAFSTNCTAWAPGSGLTSPRGSRMASTSPPTLPRPLSGSISPAPRCCEMSWSATGMRPRRFGRRLSAGAWQTRTRRRAGAV